MDSPEHRRGLEFPFPQLRLRCPLCGAAGCAVYRGYYTRLLFCPEMVVFGRIAVRTGYCRRLKRRFALLPDFLIPRRRISRPSLRALYDEWRARSLRIRAAIDELIAGLGDEFYLPVSTAHAWLGLHASMPP